MSCPGAALVAGPTGTVGCGTAEAAGAELGNAPGVARAGAAVWRTGTADSEAGRGANEASTAGATGAGSTAGANMGAAG
jgi:hypothetical protein